MSGHEEPGGCAVYWSAVWRFPRIVVCLQGWNLFDKLIVLATREPVSYGSFVFGFELRCHHWMREPDVVQGFRRGHAVFFVQDQETLDEIFWSIVNRTPPRMVLVVKNAQVAFCSKLDNDVTRLIVVRIVPPAGEELFSGEHDRCDRPDCPHVDTDGIPRGLRNFIVCLVDLRCSILQGADCGEHTSQLVARVAALSFRIR